MNLDHITPELFTQVEELILDLEPKVNQSIPADKIRLLFNLHNKVYFRNMEHSTACAGCRARVFNRLKTFYYEQRDNFRNQETL